MRPRSTSTTTTRSKRAVSFIMPEQMRTSGINSWRFRVTSEPMSCQATIFTTERLLVQFYELSWRISILKSISRPRLVDQSCSNWPTNVSFKHSEVCKTECVTLSLLSISSLILMTEWPILPLDLIALQTYIASQVYKTSYRPIYTRPIALWLSLSIHEFPAYHVDHGPMLFLLQNRAYHKDWMGGSSWSKSSTKIFKKETRFLFYLFYFHFLLSFVNIIKKFWCL